MRIAESVLTPKLSPMLEQLLTEISKSRTLPACMIQRAKLFLLAAKGKLNKEIAPEINLHPTNVGKWRMRFVNAMNRLEAVEADKPEELRQEVNALLKDACRAGASHVYTSDQRSFIITIACQNPEDHGFELSHWNLSALRLAVIQIGIVEDISVASISRILKENEIQPHKIQYWLHSTEKADDPETYKAKVQAINAAYAQAKELAEADGEGGIRILSTDEMTGVQALEHKFPDKPPAPGMRAKQEFEYIRHGTVSVTAFLDVVTGTIEKPYLNSTRTETDFVNALDQVIQTDPEKCWVIIADNLNTHYSASLVEYIAGAIGYTDDIGKKGKYGILKDTKSRISFLTDPSHRIRFLFTPKHCSWMNQIEIWFGIVNRQLLKRKSYRSVNELVESFLNYVEQYNRLFAHPFNWKYKTTPLGD